MSGSIAVRASGGRRSGSVGAAQVASVPGARSQAVSTWRARDSSPCRTFAQAWCRFRSATSSGGSVGVSCAGRLTRRADCSSWVQSPPRQGLIALRGLRRREAWRGLSRLHWRLVSRSEGPCAGDWRLVPWGGIRRGVWCVLVHRAGLGSLLRPLVVHGAGHTPRLRTRAADAPQSSRAVVTPAAPRTCACTGFVRASGSAAVARHACLGSAVHPCCGAGR